MTVPPLEDRLLLADRVLAHKDRLAAQVTERFLLRHPDWTVRYGERAQRLGREDAAFHLDFLAGAIEAGTVHAFERYATWAARVLESRGIAPAFLQENLEDIGDALQEQAGDADCELVRRFIQAGVSACVQGSHPSDLRERDAAGARQEQRLFLEAIRAGNRRSATNIALEALRHGLPVLSLYVDIIQRSLYEVGGLWETNRITVAEEHIATAVAQSVLGAVYERLPLPGKNRGTVLLAGVAGELHQIGANMVADVLETDGWRVHFLGTNVPPADILQAIDRQTFDVVGLSSSLVCHVPRTIRLVQAIQARSADRSPRILLGGTAFRFAPGLVQEVGADALAGDLTDVLQCTQEWA